MSPIQWPLYTERAIGKGHPTLSQTVDRALRQILSESGYDPDATTFPGLMGPVFNIKAFGALTNGSDTSPAVSAAAAAANAAGGGVVYMPPGFFSFLTPISLTDVSNIVFRGSGRNTTSIVQAADTDLFALHGLCVRILWEDLWLGSFASRASGIGISATAVSTPHSELHMRRCTFQNLPNAVAYDNVHQSTAADIRIVQTIAGAVKGVSYYNIRSISHQNERFTAFATAGDFPADVVRLDSDCDSVHFDHVDFANLGLNAACAGIRYRNSVGGGATGPRLCHLNNFMVELAGAGAVIEDCRNAQLTNMHLTVNGASGLTITGGTSIQVIGGLFLQNQQHGIGVVGGTGVEIIGAHCSDNGQQTANTYDGIRIDGGVVGVKVDGCKSGDFIFASAKQRMGIGVISATATCLTDNQVKGNVTAGISDLGTATYRRGNRVTDGPNSGRAVLVNGTVTVSTTEVLASDNIALTRVVGAGTTRGALTVGTIVAGTSFVIRSEDAAGALSPDDDSTVFWEIVH